MDTTTHHFTDVPIQTHGIMPGGCVHPSPTDIHHPPVNLPHIPHDGHNHSHIHDMDNIIISGPNHVIHHDHHIGSIAGQVSGRLATSGVHTCTGHILMK